MYLMYLSQSQYYQEQKCLKNNVSIDLFSVILETSYSSLQLMAVLALLLV